jgi:hypothetical protein
MLNQKPKSFPIPVAPTREFCIVLLISKIEATITKLGDMIGWESNKQVVGPIAVAAKQSLLRLVPHITPADSDQNSLYRLVLDHGDFGIHNMTITMDANAQPLLTSLYDWERGDIVPAILSDPLMAVTVDLMTDEHAGPSITRVSENFTPDERAESMTWAEQYFKVRFDLSLLGGCEQKIDYFASSRRSSIMRPITNVLSRPEETRAISGLP